MSFHGQIQSAAAARGEVAEFGTCPCMGGHIVYTLNGVKRTPGEAAALLGIEVEKYSTLDQLHGFVHVEECVFCGARDCDHPQERNKGNG